MIATHHLIGFHKEIDYSVNQLAEVSDIINQTKCDRVKRDQILSLIQDHKQYYEYKVTQVCQRTSRSQLQSRSK